MEIINLELYKVFYVVASEGNISRAAEILYTGQPSISKSIKKLEGLLETKLFIRSSKGVVLTEAGDMLFKHVSKALNEINKGELAVKKWNNTSKGKLSIGISPMLYKYYVFPHLKDFLGTYNSLIVNITDNSKSYEIIESVKQGSLDLGIVSKPFNCEGIDFIPISKIQEIFISSPEYLEKIKTSNINKFFHDATLIFLEKGNVAREYNEEYFREIEVEIHPEISTSNMDFIIELVTTGIGIGIVYKESVKEKLLKGSLIEISFLPKIPSREIGIITKKDCLIPYSVKVFIDYYKNIFRL